jgi:Spy/CpxP family protein refolding chaperone
MMIKPLKLVLCGLMGAFALNVATPLISTAKDPAKSPVQKVSPSIWEELKLTKEQKGKLQIIRTKRTNAISKVLRKDQKVIFDQWRGKKKMADILKELKLDATQQKAITLANQQAAKDIMAVLTPDQQKQLNARKAVAE